MNLKNSRKQKKRGIALIWMMLLFMVLIGIAGLLIDTARIFITAHQLHNAADAAALAGSRYVPMINEPNHLEGSPQSPEGIAQYYASQHVADNVTINLNTARYGDPNDLISSLQTGTDIINPYDITGDIVIGRYIDDTRLFIVDHATPDSMLVMDRRDGSTNVSLPLMFGPIFGIDTVNVKRYAIAKVDNPYGAGVLALGECCDCPGILFGGSGAVDDLTIFGGGSLYVNSCYVAAGNSGAVDQSGNAPIVVNLDRLYAVGNIDPFFDLPDDTDVHDYTDSVTPEPDPYENVPDAVYATTPDLGTITAAGTYSPGYYSGGIQITDTQVNLEPGDYYLDSVGQAASLNMTGGLLTGEGVTLHIIGSANIGVDIGGNANIDISAPTTGPYADIAIFQARNLDYNCELSCSDFPLSEFNGTGVVNIDGAVYMPHNKLTLGGTGDIFITRAVADRFHIYGNGQKIVDYKGTPKVAAKSYLVE